MFVKLNNFWMLIKTKEYFIQKKNNQSERKNKNNINFGSLIPNGKNQSNIPIKHYKIPIFLLV